MFCFPNTQHVGTPCSCPSSRTIRWQGKKSLFLKCSKKIGILFGKYFYLCTQHVGTPQSCPIEDFQMARTKKKYFFTRTFCYIFLKKNICFKHIACGYSLVFSYFKMARLTKFNTFPNFSKMYYIFGKYFFFKHIACGYSLVLSHQGLSDIKVDLSIPKCVCRFVRKNCK